MHVCYVKGGLHVPEHIHVHVQIHLNFHFHFHIYVDRKKSLICKHTNLQHTGIKQILFLQHPGPRQQSPTGRMGVEQMACNVEQVSIMLLQCICMVPWSRISSVVTRCCRTPLNITVQYRLEKFACLGFQLLYF